MPTLKALVLEEHDRKVSASVREIDESRLPDGDVTVDVEYSSLNYKDAMIVRGIGRMVRTFPFVPGIDLAGTVRGSTDARYKTGDKVILTGWRVGEAHWGGYAQRARVSGDWLVPLPVGMSTRHAMTLGTAGLTAMIAIAALEEHAVRPNGGPVLVTGATGGVGSLSVALLARLGYTAAASTGKSDAHAFLRDLGAAEIVDRSELSEPCDKPLERERWGGCIDNVGGVTLARVLSQTKWHGSVAAVGLAGGNVLTTTLLPFLLRGVNLLGIDSNTCPTERRLAAWNRLQGLLPGRLLDSITTVVGLDELPAQADAILAGKTRGRIVVDTRA